MNELRNFFIFCSGSNMTILKRTPTEINKHVGIGATILFTGVFAALAGAYAIHTVFNSYVISIVIGLLWGLMIFNLDRYIISSLKMKQSIFRNLGGALPRIVLATIIAIVIAKPLELKIFDTEINSELALMQQENIIEQENLLRSRFEGDIKQTKDEIDNLNQRLSIQETKRDQLDALAINEADGTGGSLKRNMGPIYRAKKIDATKAQSELDILRSEINPQLQEKQNSLLELNNRMETKLSELKNVELSGFAARLDALDRLCNKSKAIYIASLFIMILFIVIETTPLFVKLISSRSPYDYVLDKHEHVFAMQHALNTQVLSNEVQNKLNFDTKVGAFKTAVAIDTEKRIIKEAMETSYEDLKSKTNLWKNIFGKSSLFDF